MAFTGFALALSSVGPQIYAAETQKHEAKRSRRQAERAQASALGAARRTELENAEMQKRANRMKPDISAFLAQNDGKPSTALSGSAGVRPDEMLLSRITPLGA